VRIDVRVDFETEYFEANCYVKPDKYLEAMKEIENVCKRLNGKITYEDIYIGIKGYAFRSFEEEDKEIIEMFKRDPIKFIEVAKEVENDPSVITRDDVIEALHGKKLEIKDVEVVLVGPDKWHRHGKTYHGYSVHVIFDGKIGYYLGYVEVPEEEDDLGKMFKVSGVRIRSVEDKWSFVRDLRYTKYELKHVADVIFKNKDKIKRILDLGEVGLESAQRDTIHEYEQKFKKYVLLGKLDELEKELEKRVKKVRKADEARKKRYDLHRSLMNKWAKTDLGYLYVDSWNMLLIQETDDDIVLYEYSGSESYIASKTYTIVKTKKIPSGARVCSLKENFEGFKRKIKLYDYVLQELKQKFPDFYLKLQLLGVVS